MYKEIGVIWLLFTTAIFGGCIVNGDRSEDTSRGWWLSLSREWRVPKAPKGFVTRWELTEDTVDGRTVNIPCRGAGFTPNIEIVWGDGSPNSFVTDYTDPDRQHVYATTGTKTVLIKGKMDAWYFNNTTSWGKLKLKSVEAWDLASGFRHLGMEGAFYGCENAVSFAEEMPAFAIISLSKTWQNCYLITKAPKVKQCLDVNTLYYTWSGCRSLISAPDVKTLTNVTTLASTWASCSNLVSVSEVGNLLKVNTLASTWAGCASLPSAPDVNTLTNVTTLASAWSFCSKLETPSQVSNLVKVTTLLDAWKGCESLMSAPHVNTLTNVTTLAAAWQGCSKLENAPEVSNLVKVSNVNSAWNGCRSLVSVPAVNTLTNVAQLTATWSGCSNLLIGVSVTNLLKLSLLNLTWKGCVSMTNSVQSILGDPLMPLTLMYQSKEMFSGCEKLSGRGMPFVLAAQSGLFKNTYTIGTNTTSSSYRTFYGCTNLEDYADIPIEFK